MKKECTNERITVRESIRKHSYSVLFLSGLYLIIQAVTSIFMIMNTSIYTIPYLLLTFIVSALLVKSLFVYENSFLLESLDLLVKFFVHCIMVVVFMETVGEIGILITIISLFLASFIPVFLAVEKVERDSDYKSSLPHEHATELKLLEERLIENEEDRFIPRAEAIWREVEVGASNYDEMKQELDGLIKENLMKVYLIEANQRLSEDKKKVQVNKDLLNDLKNV